MKTTIPEKTVDVCDFCHREGYLETCDVCGRQFCLIDNGIVAGSYGSMDICKECARRDDVHKVCERYAKQLKPIYKRRMTALRRLPNTTNPDEGGE